MIRHDATLELSAVMSTLVKPILRASDNVAFGRELLCQRSKVVAQIYRRMNQCDGLYHFYEHARPIPPNDRA